MRTGDIVRYRDELWIYKQTSHGRCYIFLVGTGEQLSPNPDRLVLVEATNYTGPTDSRTIRDYARSL
jgi:hypothetical protein